MTHSCAIDVRQGKYCILQLHMTQLRSTNLRNSALRDLRYICRRSKVPRIYCFAVASFVQANDWKEWIENTPRLVKSDLKRVLPGHLVDFVCAFLLNLGILTLEAVNESHVAVK